MPVTLRPVTAADVDPLCRLLAGNTAAAFPPARWRRVFDHPWRPPGADRGLVAVEGGRIVGLLGVVRTDRPTGAGTVRCGNLTCWHVLASHRGRGIGRALLAAVADDPATTLTNLTPAPRTLPMMAAAGFLPLDSRRHLIRPRGGARLAIVEAAALPGTLLDPAARTLVADHAGLPLRFAALRADGRDCLLAVRRGPGSLQQLVHVGDPAFLAAHVQGIADTLLDGGGDGAVLAVDSRWLAAAPAGGETVPIPLPRLWRPGRPSPAPAEIDALYSEIPLLDIDLP